jgi:hypothetical protein
MKKKIGKLKKKIEKKERKKLAKKEKEKKNTVDYCCNSQCFWV